jgi:type 1 glutamine amidotransferase
MKRHALRFCAALVVAAGALCAVFAAGASSQEKKLKVLVITGGPIHDAHGIGVSMEATLKADPRFEVTRVENDLDALVAPKLDPYDAIVFEWTVSEIGETQKRGLMNAVASGKGLVGIHSACDSFRGDPDWRALWGAHFLTHPAYGQFQVSVTEEKSPITEGLDRFFMTDEQYILEFDATVQVLANGLWKGKLMPAIWTKPWGKGRVYYMSFGHDPKACEGENFKKLLVRATAWSTGK